MFLEREKVIEKPKTNNFVKHSKRNNLNFGFMAGADAMVYARLLLTNGISGPEKRHVPVPLHLLHM